MARAIGLGSTIIAAILMAIMAAGGGDGRRGPVALQAPVTATVGITATVALDTPTATRTATPPWVYLHVDSAVRVQICDGLAEVVGTVPPPLANCSDVGPWREAPPIATPGQLYILWPGDWRYRVYIDATPTPVPGWCQPVYIVVTATPTATDTPTPTPTADWIATYVAGTITALRPTPTGTPRPTDTRAPTPLPEATPTPGVWRLTLFPLLNRRPVR